MSGIPRVKVTNHHTFYYQYEFSLLDALEIQKIPVNFNCRGGYCGCCHVKLLSGEVEVVQECLLDPPEGEIFACCCKPKTHIEIEVPAEK